MIDHTLLDAYVTTAGDPERLTAAQRPLLGPDWTKLDELLLDLHMMRHGNTTESYDRHLERALVEACADVSVVQRVKDLRL